MAKYNPLVGEFQDRGEGLEYWVDGEIVARGKHARAVLDERAAIQEEDRRKEAAASPRSVLLNLTDEQAAALLKLIGTEVAG